MAERVTNLPEAVSLVTVVPPSPSGDDSFSSFISGKSSARNTR
jgi:hypothetical protein